MKDQRELVSNVWDFLNRASADYGKFKEQEFSQNMYSLLTESEPGPESPIEDLFYIACYMHCMTEFIDVAPDPIEKRNGEVVVGCGVWIKPQSRIGNYRVDFIIEQTGIAPADQYTPVVVELDGHDFHDKDKRQRAYEKQRDRFLVKQGYRVIHFTGSEVVADPYKVAFEALSLVGVFVGSCREEYDPDNPLFIE